MFDKKKKFSTAYRKYKRRSIKFQSAEILIRTQTKMECNLKKKKNISPRWIYAPVNPSQSRTSKNHDKTRGSINLYPSNLNNCSCRKKKKAKPHASISSRVPGTKIQRNIRSHDNQKSHTLFFPITRALFYSFALDGRTLRTISPPSLSRIRGEYWLFILLPQEGGRGKKKAFEDW